MTEPNPRLEKKARPLSVEDAAADWTANRRAVYAELRGRGVDPSRLAELLARYGASILDKDLPYLLVALRRLAIDEHRRESREVRLADRLAADTAAPFTESDPAEIVASRAAFTAAMDALANLDEADAWALWWHAAGFNDGEIAHRWNEAGFLPASPSPALLRKRRQRARQRLRELLGEE